jgi:hypothetical protein
VREIVAIWYRGSNYQIGRGRDFYGIWPAAQSVAQPLESWPLTREGWYGAWSRFTAVEAPGTIVQAGPPAMTPQGPQTGAPGGPPATPPHPHSAAPSGPVTSAPSGPYAHTPSEPHAPIPPGPRIFMPAGPAAAGPRSAGPAAPPVPVAGGERETLPASASRPAVIGAVLLVVGVAFGVIGLFPHYLGGTSLAQAADELVPHVIYLAGWAASAVLILLGGNRARAGALLGMGLSVVTFGFFFADLGTVIAGSAHLMGAGLVLSLVGWLFCAAGSLAAFLLLRTGAPGWSHSTRVDSVLTLTLAGLGAAIAFAPSWDSYTLQTPTGASATATAGDAFKNPAPVIAGDVAVMIALVAVVVIAALWRPAWNGAVLLAGAIIPMAAQAISAIIGVAEGASTALFGIPPAAASQAGITISSGVTPAFWIYCAFVAALAVLCARILIRSRPGPQDAIPPGPLTLDAPAPATSAFR